MTVGFTRNSNGLSNQPKLLRGAFVDSNLIAFPPLVVPFQFNPETITRRLTTSVVAPPSRRGKEEEAPATEELGEAQTVRAMPETATMDIRLDATDALDEGDPVAGEFGVLPALSALEMMVTPRSDSVFGGLLGLSADFGFGDRKSTPVVIFVWGRQRVYAVRLTDLNVQETEYSANLNPVRVTVGVSIQVIAGKNPFYLYTQTQRELLAGMNLVHGGDLARSILSLG